MGHHLCHGLDRGRRELLFQARAALEDLLPGAPSVMYAGNAKTDYGYLKPRHTAGTFPVRIYKYRYVSGRWKSYGYVKAKASNSSTHTMYSASVKLPYKDKWRLRAYHPADAGHAASRSANVTVT